MVVTKSIKLKIWKDKPFILKRQKVTIIVILNLISFYMIISMTDIRQKKEDVKMHLKDLRQNLKKMHLAVTEELLLPQPDEVKTLMSKMDQLLKVIESK